MVIEHKADYIYKKKIVDAVNMYYESHTGTIEDACEHVGIPRATYYAYRTEVQEFKLKLARTKGSQESHRVQVSVSDPIYKKLKRESDATKVPISALCAKAIADYVRKNL